MSLDLGPLPGLILLLLAAFAYSWAARAVLARARPRALIPLALGAALLCGALLTWRVYHVLVSVEGPLRPGVLPATALVLYIFCGAGFAGASVNLWRKWRASPIPGKPPLIVGVTGFFIGIALPVALALGTDVWRVLRK